MMSLSTPALLFGSISLLFLAYTNRFTALSKFIRELSSLSEKGKQAMVWEQIHIVRKRLQLIKNMQISGILSFLLCTGSLFSIFLERQFEGKFFFVLSILTLLVSLVLALWEVSISTKALDNILQHTQQLRSSKKK